MTTDGPDRKTAGFAGRTPLSDALEALREHVVPVERTEPLPLSSADGRVLAEPVVAGRDVPHYRRAAMDGYAVRSADTEGASERSPAVLRVRGGSAADAAPDETPSDGAAPAEATSDDTGAAETTSDGATRLEPGTAVRVHTGSAVPDGADAVVPVEHAERVGDDLELTDPVAPGDDVAPVGEDVEAGQLLHEPGHRLRPSDLGLFKAAGVDEVTVRGRPTVGVVPTGDELVQRDPAPGQAVETNGLTVSKLIERWGGRAAYRNVVGDDPDALRAAIQRDLTKDVVVTTGGSSVGERDLLPEVVEGLGEVLVHGVAVQPGHPVALGVVEDTPVLVLPGYPVSCIVTAVQFLRPLLAWLLETPLEDPPTRPATLSRKLDSEPGTRTFARVALEYEDGRRVAKPTRARGAGVLSSVALADGWIAIEEDVEGLSEGELVAVQDWEWLP